MTCERKAYRLRKAMSRPRSSSHSSAPWSVVPRSANRCTALSSQAFHRGVIAGRLRARGAEEHAAEALDLVEVVDLRRVELGLQRVELVGLGTLADLRHLVVGLERAVDLLRVVDEVEDEGVLLARSGAVEARERLHRLHATEPFVDVHGVQQRLVEACLVPVSYTHLRAHETVLDLVCR